jgi:Xaa-Pro aminopeptidase
MDEPPMATGGAAASDLTESERLRRELVAEKHAQAGALLRAHSLDCWLTFAREGSDLLLPYLLGNEEIVGTTALLLFADGPSVAIVADYDVAGVEALFDRVLSYSLDWREPFRQVLSERRPARIGINISEHDHGVDGLTHGLYLTLTKALAPLGLGDVLVSSEPVASRIRALKTPAEIERIRRAAALTVRIFDDVGSMLKPGLTEEDVFEIARERMQTYEVEPAWEAGWCPTVASSRSAGGHAAAGTTRLEAGDGVRLDFGVRSEGYCADLQRTWYLRRPGETAAPDELRRPFEAVRDGIELAAELLRPGVRGFDVDTPVRALIAERGWTFTHALGHQLGRLAHDGGMLLGPDNARYGALARGTVEAGMVFTLEPVVGPVGLEEDVLVTDGGCDYLTAPQREIFLI